MWQKIQSLTRSTSECAEIMLLMEVKVDAYRLRDYHHLKISRNTTPFRSQTLAMCIEAKSKHNKCKMWINTSTARMKME